MKKGAFSWGGRSFFQWEMKGDTADVVPLWFGLPERIRTFDLQSRSLTRYPAVPRVDMKFVPCYYTTLGWKLQALFRKNVRRILTSWLASVRIRFT